MGGDGAPQVAVRGALEAITDFETPVLLVGPQKRLRRELGRFRFLPSGSPRKTPLVAQRLRRAGE